MSYILACAFFFVSGWLWFKRGCYVEHLTDSCMRITFRDGKKKRSILVPRSKKFELMTVGKEIKIITPYQSIDMDQLDVPPLIKLRDVGGCSWVVIDESGEENEGDDLGKLL